MGNIPEETTSFVGRQHDLARVAGALADHRLVTLTGAGGVGKSRLALRAASLAAADYPDGVWWADLSHLDGDRLLLATVSDAVDLSDHTPRMPLDALSEWLTGKNLLLVLDSCEHLAAACRHLTGELLTAAPGLTVLATTREPLHLDAEHLIEVEPLPADGADALSLFLERVTWASPGPGPTEPARAAATDICRRLEGIPLAIELAAAQVGPTSLEDVSARLGSRLDLLTTSEQVWPRRHQTMRTTIGWSHELCTPIERLAWARLTVFRGYFDVGSARSVCAGGPLTADQVGPLLDKLVAMSIVKRHGERYRMLDAIREYGRLWLRELDEERTVADRHADHCLHLAQEADAGWLGPGQVQWYRRIDDAYTDLCTALDHLLVTDPRRALRLAGLIGFFWSCCGHLHEARGYLEQGLAEHTDPGPDRTRALWALGVAVTLQGEYETANRLGEQCTLAARQDGDPEAAFSAAYLTGLTALLTDRPLAANLMIQHVLDSAPASTLDSAARIRCHLVAVFSLTALGKLSEARDEAVQLRRGCTEAGEFWTRSYLDYQLSLIALLQGSPHEAADYAKSMLEGKRGLGDRFGTALGLDLMAAALAAQGDGEGAATVYGAGQAHWKTVGHPQRGTPELRPVREECERAARASAGDAAYETAFRRAAAASPEAALAAALAAVQPPPA